MSDTRSSKAGDPVRKAASDWVARRDAGLSAAEESELNAWCEADPRHAAALARYQNLWSRLDRPRTSGVSPQLNRDLALLQQRDRRRRERRAATASLLALMLAASWWAFRPNSVVPSSASSPVVIRIPDRRVLTDGSVVEHSAGSAISVDFSSPELRRVTLVQGEAHFQVAKNPARPFIVRAAGVDIQAVGTAFSVQLARTAVEVLVTEGRVAVAKSPVGIAPSIEPGQPVSPTPTVVDAGQLLSVAREGAPRSSSAQVETISPAEVDQRLAWRNPRMEFSDTPLRDVVAAINRFAAERGGVQFAIDDPSLQSRRLSGIFRVDDANAFVGILEKGFGIEAERLGEQRIILRRGDR